MPLYMTQVGYTSEAVAALTQNPEDRSEAFGRLAETMGGRLVSFYNSFGEYDSVVIYEALRREHGCGDRLGRRLSRSSQQSQDHRAAHH